MPKGPGYTVNDLAFWGGLILGTSGTHVLLVNLPAYRDLLDRMDLLAFSRIITLGLSVLVGVALGAAAGSALRSYQASQKAARADSREDYRKDYHEERDEHDPRR